MDSEVSKLVAKWRDEAGEAGSDLDDYWLAHRECALQLEQALAALTQPSAAQPDAGDARDAARWRAHVASRSDEPSSHACLACGHRYTPAIGESEDCPLCGNDGTNDQPAALAGPQS